jgi:esterase
LLAPTWPIPQAVKWVAVNDYPMTYKEIGTGDPIVVVHGSTHDYRTWTSQFEDFSGLISHYLFMIE